VLQDTKPKTRYTIDAQWMQNSLLSLLPKRVADRMIAKQMKLVQE